MAAGKGTRLAPLPGAENNNKPGVKLPATVTVGGEAVPVTILEAVIKQTGYVPHDLRVALSRCPHNMVFFPVFSPSLSLCG